MKVKEIKITRVIIHKLIAKKGESPAYLIPSKSLHILDDETENTLKARILTAINKSKRFFETQIEIATPTSFWGLSKEFPNLKKDEFIANTVLIGNLAVEAHQNALRPGGLLIVMESDFDSKFSVVVIKADLQEALALRGNSVELMKELFLSPAKEFYKIGLLIQKPKKSPISPASYESYVYDDNFNPKKDDIATYFYRDFLGFSTSENDKLKTNNFLRDFLDFVDHNVSDFTSRKNIKIRIKADYRESSNMIVDPTDYIRFFDNSTALSKGFSEQVLAKYPISFTKDLTLVESSLKKGVLTITDELKMVGPADLVDTIEVVNPNTSKGSKKLTMEINSGNLARVVLINNSQVGGKSS